MKCPKCGFVSFPHLRECQKCGSRLDSLHEQEPASARNIEVSSEPQLFVAPSREISDRVANFRRRRGALTESDLDSRFRGSHPEGTRSSAGEVPYSREHEKPLTFDFSAGAPARAASADVSATSPAEQLFDQVFDRAFAEQTSRVPPVKLESVPLNPRSEIEGSSSFAENFTGPAARGSQIVQFAEAPFSFRHLSEEPEYAEVICAPLAARFAAGLIDMLLLLAGGCIFAALFMAAGGHLDKTPLDVGIALFIAAFWLFVYFAVFGSITRRTPGHAALGLEIRNLNGEPPTITDSLLRAFGVLVSISALALGLLWAALDSDGMGWHDHISGTVPSEGAKSNPLQGAP